MSAFSDGSVRVRAPATCANLGPGFDSFGLAVGCLDAVEVERTSQGVHVEVAGEGADSVPTDESHLVVRAIRATFDLLGVGQPGIRLSCTNRIPQSRGLGSSAAAIVSGIQSAEALVPGAVLGSDQALTLAAALDGHPDNVAACLLGRFTVAWAEGAVTRAVSLDVHRDVSPVLFVPPTLASTRVARELLPQQVPHVDARVNAGRAGLFVAAVTRYPHELLAATEDRLHQSFRRSMMPASLDLVDRLREAGVAAVISGAGPTVLALTTSATPVQAVQWTPVGWACLRLPVADAAEVVRT